MAQIETHIWDRFPDETEDQFRLFEAYKNKFRAIPPMVDEFYPDAERQSSRIHINQVAKAKRWKERCIAFDRWIGQQKDQAVAEMVRNEVALIAKHRVQLLRSMHRKVNAVGKKIDLLMEKDKDNEKETHIGAVSSFTYVAKALLDEWRKIEESNPLNATPEKPFSNEVQGANERLLEIIAKRSIETEPQTQKTILQ